MMKKVEDVIQVDKLCALLLMEAYFNLLTKLIFSRRMVTSSEEQNRIPEGMF